MMFSLVLHDACSCWVVAFLALGAGAVPSSLLVSHILVWAMLEVWCLLDGIGWLLLVPVTILMVLDDIELVPEGV